MSVGNQATKVSIDQSLSGLSVQARELMQTIANLSTQVNGQGAGLAYLEEIGYSSASNANNPSSQSDAAYALELLAYLNTVAGVFFGTVQAGGSGGTGAVAFNYNSALSTLWAGI